MRFNYYLVIFVGYVYFVTGMLWEAYGELQPSYVSNAFKLIFAFIGMMFIAFYCGYKSGK